MDVFVFFSPPNPLSILSFSSPHRFDKIPKENIHLVCNNNVDSLRGRKETVETLYILARSRWRPPFFLSDWKTSDWRDLTKSGRRDSVLFDTSSQGRRHFLFPVTTFSGGLYQSIASAQKRCPAAPLLRFRVVKPANFWADLRRTCEAAPLAGNWIHIQGAAGCRNVA